VSGLGRKRLADIRAAWAEHAQQREAMVFLQGLGVGPGSAARVLARYGMAAPEVVRRNPYQLAAEVQGIGFLSADRIAHELGIEHDSLLRLAAGTLYVLDRLAENGHTCYPRSQLLQETARILNVDETQAAAGLEQALLNGSVLAERVGTTDAEPCVYGRRLYGAETELADAMQTLQHAPTRALTPPVETLGDGYRRLNAAQRQAVLAAFHNQLSIITGGPGVGKTTVVGQIVAAARRLGCQILLAAPTGRAARRLSESTNMRAATIHRLLKWDPANHTFVHNRSRPLRCDLLIVDEVSMLDTVLARDLITAVKPGTHVVFVGDRDQLPSVGPGNVLHDLIASNRIPVTQLTEIYRQDANSRIVWNAHCVNRGTMPDLRAVPSAQLVDFYWVDQEDPDRAADIIARMVTDRIPQRFGLNPLSDVQVLAPMHRGSCGAQSLNELLQQRLNPGPKPQFQIGERRFRSGDRVMQTVNNYDKGVFNGELGQIVHVDSKNKTFRVTFDVGPVDYDFHDATQIQLAYAVTVHKSQGSEFPCVVMPVLTQHYIMLQRNLVYTGMTRARRLLVMVGTRKALAIAIRNDRPQLRWSRLCARIQPSGNTTPHGANPANTLTSSA
jgi:exodeoxyribonuclease V alpha subunit